MSLSTTIRAMVRAGATPEMILAVVEAHEATHADALAARRAADAERQKAKRERDSHVTSRDSLAVTRTVSSRTREVLASLPSLRSEEVVEEEPNGSLSTSVDARPEYPSAFEAAWKAYPHVRGRSSKSKALGFWRRLSPARRDALPAAIERYARNGREPNEECGAPAMDRWLRDQRFLDWLDPASDTPVVVPLSPKPRSYAEQASSVWDEAKKRIIADGK